MPDARVYIWYPDGGHIGHASMHIGDHQEGADLQWYVSWWPQGGAGPTDTVIAEPATYNDDLLNEGGAPHVVYEVNHLNINTMKAEWDGIRDKPLAHYRFLPKNCSTVVARILRAGGAGKHLNPIKELSYAHNAYWTPKNVAQFCNQLRDAGEAVKTKSVGCPTKPSSKLAVVLGLR